MKDSGTVPECVLCKRPIEPFGKMGYRFFVENLDGEICVECAREHAPERLAEAEAMERQWKNWRD